MWKNPVYINPTPKEPLRIHAFRHLHEFATDMIENTLEILLNLFLQLLWMISYWSQEKECFFFPSPEGRKAAEGAADVNKLSPSSVPFSLRPRCRAKAPFRLQGESQSENMHNWQPYFRN